MVRIVEAKGSIGKVAKELDYSKSTVWSQIQKHNLEIIETGECSRCRRAGSDLSTALIMKNKRIVGVNQAAYDELLKTLNKQKLELSETVNKLVSPPFKSEPKVDVIER